MMKFMETWRELGQHAAKMLNEVARRRAAGEPDPPIEIERFDFTKPPPGHYWVRAAPGFVRQGHGRLRPLDAAWARWKSKRDPPGMRTFLAHILGAWRVADELAGGDDARSLPGYWTEQAPARAAAWQRYEDWLRGGSPA